jgi:hypothetical protein
MNEALPNALTARDVCQLLREATFGRCVITRAGAQPWNQIEAGPFTVTLDGWQLTVFKNDGALDFCQHCASPDGRQWAFDNGSRYGTDPVALLSTWERETVEGMFKQL